MTVIPWQPSLDLSAPADHAEMVHSGTRHGSVFFWEKMATGRWTKCRPDDDLPAMAQALRHAADAYLSVNQFDGWRQVRLLRSLRALYVDLDGITDIGVAVDALTAARMPAPSFAVLSGRGLHLYWLLRPTPPQALPVWQMVQNALIKALAHVGADPACRDCTRVLRLVGTVNSKNGAETRGLMLTQQEWDLHTLADEVLGPRKKASVRDIEAAAARRAKTGRTIGYKGSIYSWWYLVYRDLVRLSDLEFHGRIPKGRRDKFLFLMAVSLGWFAQADAVEDEILSAGRRMTDFRDAEILKAIRPVVARSRQASVGAQVIWDKKPRDPRYFFKAETLREWIGLDVIERHAQHLRALAPAAVIEARRTERDRARWDDHYTGQGVRESNESKRATARLMRAQGASLRAIAAELEVSPPTIARWVDE